MRLSAYQYPKLRLRNLGEMVLRETWEGACFVSGIVLTSK